MLPGLYSAATAMAAATTNHEVIAHNLAHLNVPGFRRGITSYATFETAMQAAVPGSATSTPKLGTRVEAVKQDFTPGRLEITGQTLDVALQGDGFFVLEGPNGPLYTRNGVFSLDRNGKLVNTEGLPVRGQGGPITVPSDAAVQQIRIGSDGTVRVSNREIGRLGLVRFVDNRQLIPAGTTTFEAAPGTASQPFEGTVVQGARESSNVLAVDELIRLMGGLRHFEAAQRALRSIAEAVQQNTSPRG